MRDSLRKYLAAATLLVLPIIAACGEDVMPPPPTGSIVGQVSIEGMGIDGVSVSLSNGASTATAGGGNYRFDGVEQGSYTVTISGFPADASFDQTSAPASIGDTGGTVTVDFRGTYIRTAAIMGTVTVENMGLGGVAVRLSGAADSETMTDNSGQYSFTGLRAGTYQVEISGFDTGEVSFSSTSGAATVGVGESKVVSFDGTYLRTAGIIGTVTVEGEGLANVTVSLTGGPDGNDETTMTDAAGQYSFSQLRAGEYAVGISGYDTDDYEFVTTSQSVTIAVGETANVPFEGTLLRTSGVSGRVSVEGMGIADVAVTLSGSDMDDRMTTTDAGGQYAFAGLAAGDYTVSISVESEAYVFDEMSKDVSVGDDQTAIVNFEGAHATTASVSGMLFIDEAAKNDSYDDGEDPLPAAGIPLVLVGPGVNDQQPTVTNEMGQFMFANLKAGPYQLVVPITPEVQTALGDYAYGGPSTGYTFDLAVGQQETQAIPFDITHQTVAFSVWLKHGDMTGDALPGAKVTLYADQAGSVQVGSGVTAGEDALTAIRFARAGTSGNTVFAAIEADGYDVGSGMQAVMWDPKYPAGDVVTNTADIVNLSADVSFSGATITTAAGGGYPLSEWAITVQMMGADGMAAVEGAPEAFGEARAADDGMASFMSTAASADDLPMTYYFGVVGAEDQSNSLDGGEMFMVTPMPSDYAMADGGMLKFVHDGLKVAGKMDLGSLEVKYTTQTLRVWAHQEKDQVPGYTSTIQGGDSRPWYGGLRSSSYASDPNFRTVPEIAFELRHIDAEGRSRPVPDYDNRIRHPYTRYGTTSEGYAVYTGVPTDLNIVVKATAEGGRRIIGLDEAQAWRDFEGNKVLGSAFGEHGGFHHSVALCPETRDDPDQDFLITSRCSTFAYVWTHDISGDALSKTVEMAENPVDGHVVKTTYHSGIQLSLNPVARKNVQADNFGSVSRVENTRTTARELGTYSISDVGDGDYTRSASSGWTTSRTYLRYTSDETSTAVEQVGATSINIYPNSVYVYGTVTDEDGVPVQDVVVSSGGTTTTTDDFGRYILPDLRHFAWTYFDVVKAGHRVTNRTQHAIDNDYIARLDLRSHVVQNNPQELNFSVTRATPTGTVSGTITHLTTNAALEGIRVFALQLGESAPADLSEPGLVQVDRDADGDPVFTIADVPFADVDTTDADGNFSVQAPAGARTGQTTTIFAYRSGMFFTANLHEPTVVEGGEYSLPFRGLKLSAIDGYIRDADGNGIADVMVTASGGTYGTSGVTRMTMTTAPNGRYNIRVPWGPYDVTPMKDGYTFNPNPLTVTLGAEDNQTSQNFEATFVPDDPIVTLALSQNPISESDDATTTAVDESKATVTASLNKAHTADVTVTVSAAGDADAFTGGSGTLTIAAGSMASTGDVMITAAQDDDMDDETVTVSGTASAGVTGPADVELMITDDDEAAPQVTLLLDGAAEDKSIEEGGMVTVTATVTPAATTAFTVTVGEDGASTQFGADGTGNAMLYFPAGATMSSGNHLGVAVEIHAINDNRYTGEREVTVSGTVAPANSGVLAPESHTLTVMDDDVASMVSLMLSRPSIDEADDATTTDVTENVSVLTATLDRAHDADITVTVTVTAPAATDPAWSIAGTADGTNYTVTIPEGSVSSAFQADGTTANTNNPNVTITAVADDTDAMDHTIAISGVATSDNDGYTQPAAKQLMVVDDDAAPSDIGDLAATAPAPSANTQVDITLTWTAPTSFGTVNGTAATAATVGYQYRQKTSGASSWGTWTDITPAAGTGANAGKQVGTVANVDVNDTYNYQVRTVAPSGPASNESNTATVVVPPATS